MTETYTLDVRPRVLDIGFNRGDSFGEQWEIDIPDYSGQGGPISLDEPGVEVRAQIRYDPRSPDILESFEVRILNPETRTIQPYLKPEQTANINQSAFWDIELYQAKDDDEDFLRTFLRGRVLLGLDITR